MRGEKLSRVSKKGSEIVSDEKPDSMILEIGGNIVVIVIDTQKQAFREEILEINTQ